MTRCRSGSACDTFVVSVGRLAVALCCCCRARERPCALQRRFLLYDAGTPDSNTLLGGYEPAWHHLGSTPCPAIAASVLGLRGRICRQVAPPVPCAACQCCLGKGSEHTEVDHCCTTRNGGAARSLLVLQVHVGAVHKRRPILGVLLDGAPLARPIPAVSSSSVSSYAESHRSCDEHAYKLKKVRQAFHHAAAMCTCLHRREAPVPLLPSIAASHPSAAQSTGCGSF